MLREMLLNLRDAVDSHAVIKAERIYRDLWTNFGMDKATANFLLKNRNLWEAD